MTGSKDVGELVGLVNLTPYDAYLEKTALRFHKDNAGRRIRALTLSTDPDVGGWSQKLCALHLMEDRGIASLCSIQGVHKPTTT